MTSRNFGLTSRAAFDGGTNPQPGSRMGDAIQTPNSNSVAATPSRRFNSGGQRRQPFLDEREILAGLLFFLVPLASALGVLLSAFIYVLLVS